MVGPVGPVVAHAESEPISARSTVGIVEINEYGQKKERWKESTSIIAENLGKKRVSVSEKRKPVSDSEIEHGK